MISASKIFRYLTDIKRFIVMKRLSFIADSTTAALITEIDDITGFLPFMVK